MGGSQRKYHLKVGDRFGRWEIIAEAEPRVYARNDVRKRWLCRCDCGAVKEVYEQGLIRGTSTSCGCKRMENPRFGMVKHGKSRTPLYKVYSSMLQRCFNTQNCNYKNYGGRGIKVCDEWLGDDGFATFYKWSIKNGYAEGKRLTIDRIDVNGNYEPFNCRWVDYETQANNMRSNHHITFNGETHTISEWAKITGINRQTLQARARRGLPPERILSREKHIWQRYEHWKGAKNG